jgi:hypothetical protein
MCTRPIQSTGIIGILLLLGLNGCLTAKKDTPSDSIKPAVAKLTRADDCGDLLSKIQSDVIAKVDLYAQALRFPDKYAYSPGGGLIPIQSGARDAGTASSDEGFTGTAPSGSAGGGGRIAITTTTALGIGGTTGSNSAAWSGKGGTGTPYTSTPGDNAAGEAGAGGYAVTGTSVSSSPDSFSGTTKQVEAVDEPDIVKTDGKFLYILHGDGLFILTAWMPASLKQDSKVKIEGTPAEMFVDEGKAVVFSTVYDAQGTIRGRDNDAGTAVKIAPSDTYDGFYPEYYGTPFTKITVVNISSSTKPKVVRELYLEGNYLSARLYTYTDEQKAEHSVVRAIVTGGFKAPNLYNANIEYYDAWGKRYEQDTIDEQVDAWRDRAVDDIRATELDDWLPAERERIGEEIQKVQWVCDASYAPAPGLTEFGVTNVVAMDLGDKAGTALGGASVLGDAAEVYSNEKALILAHADWSWQMRSAVVNGEQVEGEQTALHRFDLQGLTTKYVASGFVPGHIGDQFSIDESAGIVRLSTTRDVWNSFVTADVAVTRAAAEGVGTTMVARQSPDNRVITLEVQEGKLAQVGISEPLGKPGERIQSTRFLGDTAYVVTFRQRDPLIVLNLKDPANIAVLGEVTIPGFSEYIHPLDPGHLLTIGRNTTDWGSDIGLLLQIFDVTDPANPTQAFVHPYTKAGWSEANSNHKAFTYYAERKLLAFPFVSYNYPIMSTLELFRVDTASGFEPLGSIDHTDLFLANANCKTYIQMYGYFDSYGCAMPSAEVRRGVFITGKIDGAESSSDYIYSISYAGVKVHDIADLGQEIAQVTLPAIQSTNGIYDGSTIGIAGAGWVTPVTGVGGFIVTPTSAGGAGGFMGTTPGTGGVMTTPWTGSAGFTTTTWAGGKGGSFGTGGTGGAEPVDAGVDSGDNPADAGADGGQ